MITATELNELLTNYPNQNDTHATRVRSWLAKIKGSKGRENESAFDFLLLQILTPVSAGSRRNYLMSLSRIGVPDNVVLRLKAHLSDAPAPKPSIKRNKRLPKQILSALIALLHQGGEKDKEVAGWLIASRFTGLRPSEWENTQIIFNEEGVPFLRTKNRIKNEVTPAKTPVQLPLYRIIPLDHLDPCDIDIVFRHVERATIKARANEFKSWYEAVRYRLWVVQNNTAIPASEHCISMYEARHQFIADVKKKRLPGDIQNALSGHTSTNTSRRHYGKKRDGEVSLMDSRTSIAAIRKFKDLFIDENT